MNTRRCLLQLLLAADLLPASTPAENMSPRDAVLHLDFSRGTEGMRLMHGARRITGSFGGAIEFTSALQYAEKEFARRLDGAQAATVGGWFYLRRAGEGAFLFRGAPEIAPLGERRFPPAKDWVNFFLGTDQHGFFMGCVNGNSQMPFPLVTLDALGINAWHQLSLAKDAQGGQKFYHNGVLVHTDADSCWAGKVWPFRDTADGEPLRLAMPQGGLVGEAWIVLREMEAKEIAADFEAKKTRYHPALPPTPVAMREMNAHPAAGLWCKPITAKNWQEERQRILAGVMKILGPFPDRVVPLDARVHSEEDCGSYLRRKISIQVQPSDRMPAWLLVPKMLRGRAPAIICFYGTTGGAGKDTTVGLSGPTPGSPPRKNRAFAVDMAEAGFVALAPDYLRDGERLPPSGKPYDTTDFYRRFPNWSCVGKDVWDNMRAVDYSQSLQFVDGRRIGMIGHSYGGHSTIFAAALEPRIKAAFASGPVSDFLHYGMHWGAPPGSSGSASLPGLRPCVLDHTLPLPVRFTNSLRSSRRARSPSVKPSASVARWKKKTTPP
ncbi:MAG: acetylxylan esterase [Verrucomicrobiae bacterium]|nr:acetylxylan esterase [Verrucomicrobiae bacterium]